MPAGSNGQTGTPVVRRGKNRAPNLVRVTVREQAAVSERLNAQSRYSSVRAVQGPLEVLSNSGLILNEGGAEVD